MEVTLAVVVGVLYATGLYMMLRRSLVKIIVGLSLLGNAANLLIFTSAGLTRGEPPIIEGSKPDLPFADPLPQALILTAIVISFSVLAFTAALLHRVHQVTGEDDIDELKTSDV